MKIAIQADGGYQIGMGHIMRTLVLAKELSKENEVFYICRIERNYEYLRNDDSYIKSLEELQKVINANSKYIRGIEKILLEGFTVKLIYEDNIINNLKYVIADLLITDSYNVDDNYFKETKKLFRKTAYIDDMSKYYFDVDFLINQNINAIDLKYKVNDNTKLLIGSQYVMLRNEFRNNEKIKIQKKVKNVMLTVGGADPFDVTEQILSYVKDLDYKFHVIIGTSFGNNNLLKSFENEVVKLYYNANIYEVMKKCDLAISACGSTLYEMATCGLPALGIIIADNQQGIAEKMDELGIVKTIGWYNKLSKDNFLREFNNLCNDYIERERMSFKAKKIIDGLGVKRIVNELVL